MLVVCSGVGLRCGGARDQGAGRGGVLPGRSGAGRRALRLCPRWLLLICLIACSRAPQALVEEGEQALRQLDLDAAERSFQKALEQNPDMADALYGLGWVYHSRRDIAAARVFFERCIEVAPDYYGGYKGLGSVHLAMGFYPEAERTLTRALELRPQEAATLGSLGYVYLVTRRLDLAEQHFLEALRLEPGRGELHFMMAELRSRQGLTELALEELEQVESKPILEVKFRMLAAQLRGQLYLRKAVAGLDGEEAQLPPEELAARLANLEKADLALEEALKSAVAEEMVRVNQLKRKVRTWRERLAPPPI